MPTTIHNLETEFIPEIKFTLIYSLTPGTPSTYHDPGDSPEVEITAISAEIIVMRWDAAKGKMTHVYLPFPDLTSAQQTFLASLEEVLDACIGEGSQE